jgi:RNase P subunit RPR2
MKFHATEPAFSIATHNFMRSFCPQCHDLLVAAAMSQHVEEDVVRHWWTCESCGHEFGTTVRLHPLPAEARRPAMA